MTQPGDVRPPTLERPPGERYRTATPVPVMERPRMARGLGYGLLAVLAFAAVSALLRAILDLTNGVIAVAVAGGWVIGATVRLGAWGGQPHRPSSAPQTTGAALGGACWLASLAGAWVVSMAIRPASSLSFLDRMVTTPFLDWVGQLMGLADILALLLFVGFGWFGARSTATRT